jgi:diaminohydroxyphosphoribosylaminopyrimidine deaminase/5-amino-6-(5-phosphoribosylamino)uracil reductase
MSVDELYMHKCLTLAELGRSGAAPNPMVGAVLVHKNRIIGEGFHQKYGQAHAEVNCISAVEQNDVHLISESTLYVSLEPCAHYGKTPPCANLIIDKKIAKVVIGCFDPFEEVAGRGIEKLRSAGTDVTTGILENECRELNKRFFTFHTLHRPYIILKWAQASDSKIAKDNSRLAISNEYTNRIVHKWRSEEMAILVGTNTALIDDPQLTTRLWPGNDPVRLVIDMDLKLPTALKLFTDNNKTIVFNRLKHEETGNQVYYRLKGEINMVSQILEALYSLQIQSVLIEGGAKLLQSFINEGMWDEARIITNEQMVIGGGLSAPVLNHHQLQSSENIFSDNIRMFKNKNI